MLLNYRKPMVLVLGLMILTCCGASTRTVSSDTSAAATASTAIETPTSTTSSASTVALSPKIGFNLTTLGNTTPEAPLLNRFKLGGAWDVRGGTVDPTKLNADGWPIAMSAEVLWDRGFYETLVPLDPLSANQNPNYVMRWKGTGSIDIGIAGNSVTSDHQITFQNVNGGVLVNIRATDASDPIRDISIVRADQVAAFDGGAIFNPAFVDRIVKPFSVFRTMDWDDINNTTEANWADRSKPTSAFWGRMPLEIEVALANAAGVDLWKTIPTYATDDYVRQAMAYIRDNLSPGLSLHLEYSNEVWNGSFQSSVYAAQQAKSLWGITDFGANTYYGYRAAQIASIARTTFGGAATTRLKPVLGGWYAWTGSEVTDAMAQGVAYSGLGAINTLFREYAIAPYFGDALGAGFANAADQTIVLGWAKDTTGNGLNQAFTQLAHGGLLAATGTSLDDARYTIEPKQGVWARTNGLDLVAYEGGLSFYFYAAPAANQPILQAFFQRMVDDPRMALLYTRWAQDFGFNGGKMIVAYNDVGTVGTFGPWGALPSVYAADTQRYTALRALALLNPGH